MFNLVDRLLCRPWETTGRGDGGPPTPFNSPGFRSGAAATQAIKVWNDAHLYELTVMINATVYLEGGVNRNLTSPRAVVLVVVPLGAQMEGGNPAKAFRIALLEVSDRDRQFILRDNWDRMQSACAARAAHMGTQDRFLAGFITLVSVLGTTGLMVYTQIPIHRLRHTDDTALNPQTRALLRDLVAMCSYSIANGHSYSRPPWHSRPEPVIEEYQRSRKDWKRTPVHDSVWDDLAARMVQYPEFYRSGLNPRDIWAQYRQL